jgi:hypothetical protein
LYAEAFTNLDPEARLRGHRPGDPMGLCYAAWRPDLADRPRDDALEAIFSELNSDARQNGRAFHSLSVGDVISLETYPFLSAPRSSSHAVAPAGFLTLDEPVWATAHEHNRLRERLSEPPLVRLVFEHGVPRLLGKPKGVAVEVAVFDSADEPDPVWVQTYGPALDAEPEEGTR